MHKLVRGAAAICAAWVTFAVFFANAPAKRGLEVGRPQKRGAGKTKAAALWAVHSVCHIAGLLLRHCAVLLLPRALECIILLEHACVNFPCVFSLYTGRYLAPF